MDNMEKKDANSNASSEKFDKKETSQNSNPSPSKSKKKRDKHKANSSSRVDGDSKSGIHESSDDTRKDCGTGAHNDPRDYGSEEVVKLATSWSWAHRIGNTLPSSINRETTLYMGTKYPSITELDDTQQVDSVPGVMVFRIVPTVGISNSAQSPINIAAYDQYGWLRSNISGSRPYTKSDMMIEWMAVDTCFMMSLCMDRALATANVFAQQNRYYAREVVRAMGFDFDDLQANFANYITEFNLLKSRLNTLKIPAVLPVVKRHSFMMSHVYKDDDLLVKAQLYIFTLHSGYEYDPANSAYYGLRRFDWIVDGSTVKTFRQWLTKLQTLIANISADSKFSQISGDIEKAYGAENCLAVAPSVAGQTMLFDYDAEVLYQIHHIKFVGGFKTTGTTNPLESGNIVVNTADPYTHIEYEPYVASTNEHNDMIKLMDVLLDSASESPSADEGMTDTRLTPAFRTSDDNTEIILESCGSELVMNASILTFNHGAMVNVGFSSNAVLPLVGGAASNTTLGNLLLYGCFKKAPILYHVFKSGTTMQVTKLPFCEMKTYTTIGNSELNVAHLTAVQNQFAVPVIASTKM